MKHVTFALAATLFFAAYVVAAYVSDAIAVAATFLILFVAAVWNLIEEVIDYINQRKHRTDVIRINPPSFPEQPKRGIR